MQSVLFRQLSSFSNDSFATLAARTATQPLSFTAKGEIEKVVTHLRWSRIFLVISRIV